MTSNTNPLDEACRQTLEIVAKARRERRDISPQLADAIDAGMEEFRRARRIIALEGGDDDGGR